MSSSSKRLPTLYTALKPRGNIPDTHAWDRGIESWSTQISSIFLVRFMQPPLCYFALYKQLLHHSILFSKNL
jgi:hypothetical protein